MKHVLKTATKAVLLAGTACFGSASVHANLVVNGDFSGGNTAFSTQFTYSPGNVFPPQTYDIVTDPKNSHGYATSYGDHTTGSGSMLMLNGTTNPENQLAWAQSVPVQAGTVYEFGLWTSSWYAPAALGVVIDGTPLGVNFATASPNGVWEQTTRTWSATATTSVVIEIYNTTSQYGGNDFAIDDISFLAVDSFVFGDMDGSGALADGDISAFVLALTAPGDYAATYPGLDPDVLGDFTGDGSLTNGDIAGFVAALTGGPASAVPEPTSLTLLALGGLVAMRRRRG